MGSNGTGSGNGSGSGNGNGTGSNKYPGIDKYGWYDAKSYVNDHGGYFIGNNYEDLSFPTTNDARTYKLVNNKWVVTEKSDDWLANLPSAGGRAMVGNSLA